ncbi:MAG: DUF3572 domain-containing protein [Pseudolabrys sp.]
MKAGAALTKQAAEAVAIQALSFIAGDSERLGRFLAETGIGPAEIRTAAREPGFLIGVLDHLAADERLLTSFAAEAGVDASAIGKAIAALGGHWERETP